MSKPRRSTWIIAGLILVAAGILGPLSLLAIGLDAGPAGFFIGLLMAAVPVPFYVAFALWIDRFEPEPPWLLGIAFIWGASIAIFFAMIFNGITEGIFNAAVGAAGASTLTAVLAAPFVEETAKGAALLVLFFWKRDEFDNVTDGIVYAAMVGLGFAMTENVQYYSAALLSHDDSVVFFLRGIMGPFAHPLYTSMTGIGFGIARESDRTSVKWIAPPLGLAGAMLLHAIWNLSATMGLMFFATYVVVMVPAFLAVVLIAIFSLRREARLIRKHLEHVVGEGVLSSDDVVEVTSVRHRIAASTRALLQGGVRIWIARRRFHALATELAFHAWRTSRGEAEDAYGMRAELLDDIRAVRAKLGLPEEVEGPDAALVAQITLEVPLPVM
jgi:RsiW-degrading membrane proteinase PrsW (M82 family)